MRGRECNASEIAPLYEPCPTEREPVGERTSRTTERRPRYCKIQTKLLTSPRRKQTPVVVMALPRAIQRFLDQERASKDMAIFTGG